MKKYAYALFDSVAGLYCTPFYCVSDNVAVRELRIAINQPDSMLIQMAGDYALHRLASFDDESGLFVPDTPPVHLYYASSLVLPTDEVTQNV